MSLYSIAKDLEKHKVERCPTCRRVMIESLTGKWLCPECDSFGGI